jgi:hypothetical protein
MMKRRRALDNFQLPSLLEVNHADNRLTDKAALAATLTCTSAALPTYRVVQLVSLGPAPDILCPVRAGRLAREARPITALLFAP